MFRPRLIFSLQVFQVVFVHLVCNSALFLSSCFRSFILHFLASFICISLVSRQLVLLLTLPKFLHYFYGQKWCARLFFRKISLRFMSIVFYLFFLRFKLPYHIKIWGQPVHYKLLSLNINGPKLTFMEPCIVVWLVAITNEMQLSKGIYYSTVH